MLQQTLERPALSAAPPALSSTAQDRLWISQSLSGDRQAYGRLMKKYQVLLFDLTYRVLRNRSQGEDILQDAFLQGYQRLSSFRYESKFSTWIYSIVMNRLRNHLRRNKIVSWSSLDTPLFGQEGKYAPEFPANEASIALTLERKMDIEAIQKIVTTLPLSYQSLFIMYYFQDLSMDEISNRVGRPRSTVKVYLHRARKLLYGRFKTAQVFRSHAVSSGAREETR